MDGQESADRVGEDALAAVDAVAGWSPDPDSGWSAEELDAFVRIGVPVVKVDPATGMPVDGSDPEELSAERAGSWMDELAHPEYGPVSWLAEREPSGALLSDLESLPKEVVDSDHDAVECVALWAAMEAYCAAGKRRSAAATARRGALANGLAHLVSMGIEVGEANIAGDELAIRLGISKPAAHGLVRSGRTMNGVGIPTAISLEAGDIDAAKADLILDTIEDLGTDAALGVQDRVLPKATHMSTGMLRRELAAACAAVDPAGFEDRCARAAQSRRVSRPRVLPHGMASLYAVMPAVEATQVYRAVDAAARSAKAAGDQRTTDQLRADALAAMGSAALESGWIGPAPTGAAEASRRGEGQSAREPVRGGDDPPTHESGCDLSMRVGHIGGASAHVRVVVPYSILMEGLADQPDPPDPPPDTTGLDEDAWVPAGSPVATSGAGGAAATAGPGRGLPAHQVPVPDQLMVPFLEGYGPIPASTARALAAGSTWSRLVLDTIDRTVLEASADTYRPPAAMARLVRAAQPYCASPACSVSSDSCDLNHRIPYPIGATSVWNFDPECRRDHLLITHANWRYEQDPRPGGPRTWTTAAGHVYVQQIDGTVTMAPRQSPSDDDLPPF